MNPFVWFQRAISCCQNKYFKVLNLRARTDDALYEAISCVYLVYLRMQSHDRLRDAFYHELKSKKMRRGGNEPLTLFELAFFPHVLLRQKKGDRKNHKADIDKASSYAKVIRYALAHKVKPEGFVKFIRDNGGIQAVAKAETERCPRRATQTGVRLGKFRRGAKGGAAIPVVKPPRPGDRILPLTLWCTSEMATKIIEATDEAYYSDRGHFILRGKWHDTNNAIVTDFEMTNPIGKRPIFKGPQPTGRQPGSPSAPRSVPAVRGMRPSGPLSKRMPSRPRGKGPTMLRKTPLSKTPWHG